jgi:hypothetical protein
VKVFGFGFWLLLTMIIVEEDFGLDVFCSEDG